MRILRILFFNPTTKATVAAALYSPAANMVRLEIPCRVDAYPAQPGTYYYLSILDDTRFWESHPFTVASVGDGSSPNMKTLCEQIPLLETDAIAGEGTPDTPTTKTTPSAGKILTFLIRPYDGFTSRLRDLAASASPHPAPMRVLVDGPYGHHQPLHLFNRVVFIVGGSGVVLPISYLQGLAAQSREANNITSMQLHWAVREPALAAEVIARDMLDALALADDGTLSINIYFSAETPPSSDGVHLPPQIARHYQRPSAWQIVTQAAEDCAAGRESLAVVACGPARLADDARRAVVEAMDRTLCEIEYFEEKFRW